MKKIIGFVLLISILLAVIPTKVEANTVTVEGFFDQFPHEEVTGYLVADKMPVYVFPMNGDFFYDYFANFQRTVPTTVRTYELSSIELGYKNLYLVPDPNASSEYVRFVILYHTTGTKLLALGIYDRGALDSKGKYIPSVKYYSSDVRTRSNDTEHTILGDFYPNKIINDLEAAQQILDYQAVNGPFVAGVEYSMLNVLNVRHGSGYVPGLTSEMTISVAGGICVIATNWFKMLTLEGAKITEHWKHTTLLKYFENPVGSDEGLTMDSTDATVQGPEYDLRWVQRETGWVNVTVAVMPGGNRVVNPIGDELVKTEALVMITFRFTKTKPDLSSSRIEALQNAYLAYRAGQPGTVALADGNRLVSEVPWSRGDYWSTLLAKIVPEERVSRFADELASDPLLKSLVSLRSTVNAVPPYSDTSMGTYLRNTEWYTQEVARMRNDPAAVARLTAGLNHINQVSNYFPGQKVQCFGLGVLIASMDTRFAQIGGVDIINAADLVPYEIRSGSKLVVASDTGGAVRVVKTINDVKVGDIGVRYETVVGHVFMVIGKKTVAGQTVLLIISANQRMDGQITIFEVDRSNFDAVFGTPAFLKVVIRKY